MSRHVERKDIKPGEFVALRGGIVCEVLTVKRTTTGVLVTVDLSGGSKPRPHSLGWAMPNALLTVVEERPSED